MCPRASALPDPGYVPDHVYFVGSMTSLMACGRRCVLPHGLVHLSPAQLAAGAHPNKSLLPLMGREDWWRYGRGARGVDYLVRENRVMDLPIRRQPRPGQSVQTWQHQSSRTQQQPTRLPHLVPLPCFIFPSSRYPLHPAYYRLGLLSL